MRSTDILDVRMNTYALGPGVHHSFELASKTISADSGTGTAVPGVSAAWRCIEWQWRRANTDARAHTLEDYN